MKTSWLRGHGVLDGMKAQAGKTPAFVWMILFAVVVAGCCCLPSAIRADRILARHQAALAYYSPASNATPSRTFPRFVVTMADYEAIQKGMNYEQVCALIGAAGTELSRSDVAGYHDCHVLLEQSKRFEHKRHVSEWGTHQQGPVRTAVGLTLAYGGWTCCPPLA